MKSISANGYKGLRAAGRKTPVELYYMPLRHFLDAQSEEEMATALREYIEAGQYHEILNTGLQEPFAKRVVMILNSGYLQPWFVRSIRLILMCCSDQLKNLFNRYGLVDFASKYFLDQSIDHFKNETSDELAGCLQLCRAELSLDFISRIVNNDRYSVRVQRRVASRLQGLGMPSYGFLLHMSELDTKYLYKPMFWALFDITEEHCWMELVMKNKRLVHQMDVGLNMESTGTQKPILFIIANYYHDFDRPIELDYQRVLALAGKKSDAQYAATLAIANMTFVYELFEPLIALGVIGVIKNTFRDSSYNCKRNMMIALSNLVIAAKYKDEYCILIKNKVVSLLAEMFDQGDKDTVDQVFYALLVLLRSDTVLADSACEQIMKHANEDLLLRLQGLDHVALPHQ